MKKEYVICFENKGYSGVTNLYPFLNKTFKTIDIAEATISSLLNDKNNTEKRYYIIPCYTKD
jgi:hypothetical protein